MANLARGGTRDPLVKDRNKAFRCKDRASSGTRDSLVNDRNKAFPCTGRKQAAEQGGPLLAIGGLPCTGCGVRYRGFPCKRSCLTRLFLVKREIATSL